MTSAVRLVALLILHASVMGCGGADSAPSADCSETQEEDCACTDNCDGTRVCEGDAWSSCDCDACDQEEDGNGGEGDGEEHPLGSPCVETADCSEGAFCLQADSTDWLGGGPPEAVCVADCSEDPSVCDDFADSVCVLSSIELESGQAWCLPACELGVETRACEGMPYAHCDELLGGESSGFCRPFCVFDSDCSVGSCDRGTGACVATAPHSTVGFGQSCTPDLSDCAGVCTTLAPGQSICSHRCVFGEATDCNTENDSTLSAVCAYASSSGSVGDTGFCAPLCDCNDDCLASGFVCEAFSEQELASDLGHLGLCTASLNSDETISSGLACAGDAEEE